MLHLLLELHRHCRIPVQNHKNIPSHIHCKLIEELNVEIYEQKMKTCYGCLGYMLFCSIFYHTCCSTMNVCKSHNFLCEQVYFFSDM